MTGDEDIGSPVSGIRTIDEKVRSIYGLYKKPDLFRNIIYEKTGHVYTPDMWMNMQEWFKTHL